MAKLSLKHIYKVYDGKVKAVNDFSMDIADKEFIVFVGPSGCGKSTTLRMIAGLEEITAGELQIGDDIVNDMAPKDRNIAMVFQNYALYPHMTVYDNMAFSLKLQKLSKSEIHEKVLEAAEILGITEYLDRKPKALSGGQRQRVALGRAIVRNPKVFLLDEPLSNLDAKLRAQMRTEITRLHERLQTTFIYVTHDQVEAMTMGTRIVVMEKGYVKQIDTPQNLYRYPNNKFVAGFIGTPQMNFFDGVIERKGNVVTYKLDGGVNIELPYEKANKILTQYMDGEHKVTFGIRPDDIKIYTNDLDTDLYSKQRAIVGVVENLGGETLVYGDFIDENSKQVEKGSLVLKTGPLFEGKKNDVIEIAINKDNIHVFDKETEQSIKTRIPLENVYEAKIKKDTIDFAGVSVKLPAAISSLAGMEEKNTDVIIPTNAIKLGTGTQNITIKKVESINGTTLYESDLNGNVLFIREDAQPRYEVGANVNVTIDFKSITIKDVVEPLKLVRNIPGTFVKIKEKNADNKKVINFYMNINGTNVLANEALAEKLFACKKTQIFSTNLDYMFDVDSLSITTDLADLSGICTNVLDYGKERYIIVTVNGNDLCLKSDNVNINDSVNIKIDQTKLEINDLDLDIQII